MYSRTMTYLRRTPAAELGTYTFVVLVITFLIFWLAVKWDVLPIELSNGHLSQENTGLFDALGGWAVGFAGAWTAIRIAGLATNIQQSDSIREQTKVWNEQIQHISDLNSRLTRAAYDAKRVCAAVLLRANDVYDSSSRLPEYLKNSINTENTGATKGDNREESLQATLEQKLEVLVEVIEEVSKDLLFRAVLVDTHQINDSVERSLVRNYFRQNKAREDVVGVIRENDKFCNVLDELNDGARNFGVGLMELRAKNLFEYFHEDLMKITALHKKDMRADKQTIEIADAAWLFLGLLLLRGKGDTTMQNHSQNHGFIFLALLLGSLPTDKTIQAYLNNTLEDIENTYDHERIEGIKNKIKQLSKRLYFAGKNELEELATLVEVCNNNLDYLTVAAMNTGISSHVKVNKDNGDLKDSSAPTGSKDEPNDGGTNKYIPQAEQNTDRKNN